MVKPASKDLISEDSFFAFVRDGQKYNVKDGIRSTASINGSNQWAATTHTVADILQGNLNQSNPQDQLLLINKGLTDSLKNLYNSPEKAYGFSTFTNTAPTFSATGSGAYTSTGDNGIGATVEESWVLQLPVKHPEGGLIWMRQGRGSNEMHLPVADNIKDDVANHLQYDGLSPDHKHPWDMDRVGGGIGGDGNYNVSTDQGPTRMKADSVDAPGQPGAFGVLDPLSEKFYISMAWPYNGDPPARFRTAGREDIATAAKGLNKDANYRGKKILVFSRETKRAVVCTPGDWGPHPYYSNGTTASPSINGFCAGLSSDVHYALGTKHGAEIILGWMADDTPLGPYGDPGSGSGGDLTSAIGSSVTHTAEEMKYAGNIVASHPNLIGDAFKNHLRNGFAPQVTNHAIKVWFPSINKGFHFPSLLNYLWYILQSGFQIKVNGIGYVHRNVAGETKLSNHSTGGAVDIMGIGRGSAVGYTDQRWRSENDALWNNLATLPRDTKPDESASSFQFDYGWYHVYKDRTPTHIHLGFGPTQIGTLMPALLAKPQGIQSTSSPVATSNRAIRGVS